VPSLSVVVPCYNEEGSLELFIPQLMAEAGGFSAFEVIVVDDASTDRSPQIIASLARQFGLHVITNPINLGLGGAMRRGFDAARMEWLTYFAADGQVPAEEVRKFAPFMNGYDLIIGRRHSAPDYTRYRRIASRVYTTWVSLAFGLRLRDFNWMQAWRRSLWAEYGSRSNSVFICGEFLVRSQRANPRMVEIEIAYRARRAGHSKNGSPKAALKAAGDIVRVFGDEALQGQLHLLHPRSPDRAGSGPPIYRDLAA
jgi:glycosyltransferase involved in cell wall biosynthesis